MKCKLHNSLILCALTLALFSMMVSGCYGQKGYVPYMKMNPPPDSDKPFPVHECDGSCWLHTASNMLAGAGYGNGNTVEDRANDIWNDMAQHFRVDNPLFPGTECFNGGWPATAIYWWLASDNNTWIGNPYLLVTIYGTNSESQWTDSPWTDPNGPMKLGNELRSCNMVDLLIRWPTDKLDEDGNPIIGEGGHAITLWGDNLASGELPINPRKLRVTDSDTDINGDVQEYTFDDFNNPNPTRPNEGIGWYFNAYSSNHPYINGSDVLSTLKWFGKNSVRVTGSYKIQNTAVNEATDLHYKVGTDVEILTYRTWLDWAATPTITETQSPPRELTVDWIFDKNVGHNNFVTINTEFVEPFYNSISYSDVYFTYPDGKAIYYVPDLKWTMKTPTIDGEPELILNVVGGYVIGSFDVIDPNKSDEPILRYRFVHQYLYNQNPEDHTFLLTGNTTGENDFIVSNMSFGHSYFYPTEEELWQFENWMTTMKESYSLRKGLIEISIDWKGQLPYPEGFPPSTGGNPEIPYK